MQNFTNLIKKRAKEANVVVKPLYSLYEPPTDACKHCARRDCTQKCARCGTLYCGRTCQRADWREHKTRCLFNPAMWAALAHGSGSMIFALGSMKYDHLWFSNMEKQAEAAQALESEKPSEILHFLMETCKKYDAIFDEMPDVRAFNETGCQLVHLLLPTMMTMEKKITERVIDLVAINSLCMTRRLAIAEVAKDDANVVKSMPLLLLQPMHGKAFGCTVSPAESFRAMQTIDAGSTAYVVYHFCLYDPFAVQNLPNEREPGDNAEETAQSLMKQHQEAAASSSLQHNFLVVCCNTFAFVVQAYHAHYTLAEWGDFSQDLKPSNTLSGFPHAVCARPELRGIFTRTHFWDTFAKHADLLCTNSSDARQRVTAYEALTGITITADVTRMQALCYRVNMQEL